MSRELDQAGNVETKQAPEARANRRTLLKAALSAATATVGAGALLEATSGSASANTGDPVLLGNTNAANAPTQVKWNGSSGFGGVILLANDSTYSPSGANYPAALGGWVGGGSTAGTSGVPHGIYGYTEVSPTLSVTPFGVVGLSIQGTGVRGETRSSSIASIGVEGLSPHGIAVSGTSTNGTGVSGTGGSSSPGIGVSGTGNTGVSGTGVTYGVLANATGPAGFGVSATGSIGVTGDSSTNGGIGTQGLAFGSNSTGVAGNSSGSGGTGVLGISSNGGDGVLGRSSNPSAPGNGVHAVAVGASVTPGAFGAVFAEGGSLRGVYATSTSATNAAVSAINPAGVGLQVQGRLQIQGNAVGQATMAAGSSTLTVSAPAATAASTIILTPLGDPGARLWISARAAGSFTIRASAALPSAVAIQYLIIN